MADRRMPSSFDSNEDFHNERPIRKLVRKIYQEPLIPLGTAATVTAFVAAYRAIRRGDSHHANRMFRARVAAQGFTVLAMVVGSWYFAEDRARSKELRQLQEQRDAEEKRQKWIRELEARDEEDKAFKRDIDERRAKAEERRRAKTAASSGASADVEKTDGSGKSGGVLSALGGLWPQGAKAEPQSSTSEDVAPATDDLASMKKREKNPRSSLGTLGEIVSGGKPKPSNPNNSSESSSPKE